MTENDVREALKDAVRAIPAPDLAHTAWVRARHRRIALTVGSLATTIGVTAAVATLVISVAPTSSPSAVNEPSPSSSASETSGFYKSDTRRLYDATLALPPMSLFSREDSPTFVINGRLWYGRSMHVTHGVRGMVSADDVIVPGRSNVGWMAQIQTPNLVAGWFGPMGGEFEQFPYQDVTNSEVFAASPGGKYIAMGGSLLDRQGRRIGDLPTNVSTTQAWTPVGLVFSDESGSAWLWNPGDVPTQLDSTYNVNTEGWGIVDSGGCSQVYRLDGDGAVLIFEHCGRYPLMTLSPGWAPGARLAVASDGQVFDTSTGDLVQQLDLPTNLWNLRGQIDLQWGGWWRNNSSNDQPPKTYVSYTIDVAEEVGIEPPRTYRAFIVGCTVTTGECGTMLDRYTVEAGVPFVWR